MERTVVMGKEVFIAMHEVLSILEYKSTYRKVAMNCCCGNNQALERRNDLPAS